jgi:NAD(P)-dependent dehydrogenase (short-subunit alcohol dehydrogenase family)
MRPVALITGASRGIGEATARAFAKEHWDLVLAARSKDALEQQARQAEANGIDAIAIPTDLANRDDIDRLFDQALERFGRLDALINNAAISKALDPLEISYGEWDRLLAVNLNAHIFCALRAARQMKTQKSGVIINVSSINEKQGIGHSLPYVTAKGGLQAATRELACRLGAFNVRVLTVSPGHIETDISESWAGDAKPWLDHLLDMTPLARGGRPEEVAALIVFLCSEKAAFITGTEIVIDGGRLSAIYPESLRKNFFKD